MSFESIFSNLVSEEIRQYPKTAGSVLPEVEQELARRDSNDQLLNLTEELLDPAVDALATELFTSSLVSLGFFNDGINAIAELKSDKQPALFCSNKDCWNPDQL